ncbi:MAG TPA: hypothetical protein VHP56_11880 [Solirubrobacterales bacterium]|jgi:hypothetical protein|nr:hypothetical protein [Solirubrobacterales bacterium]
MNKKLMILVAGALTALAFMSLAGAASAKETKLKCEGAGACTFTVDGGETKFSIVGGDTVKCTGVSGNGSVTNLDASRESTTSTVQLLFTNCREQNSGFQFTCTNTATAGNVTTNVMTGHNVALTTGTEAGVLLTNAGVTFTCAGGFASTQVTGSILGESETKCGSTSKGTALKQVFNTTGHGLQSLTTYTGTTFKLEGKTSHTGGGAYANAAQFGTGTLTFNQSVELTCA